MTLWPGIIAMTLGTFFFTFLSCPLVQNSHSSLSGSVATSPCAMETICMGCKDSSCSFEPLRLKRRELNDLDVLLVGWGPQIHGNLYLWHLWLHGQGIPIQFCWWKGDGATWSLGDRRMNMTWGKLWGAPVEELSWGYEPPIPELKSKVD